MKKFVAVMFLVQIIIMVIIITALLSGCNYDEIINDFSDKDIDNKSEDIPEIYSGILIWMKDQNYLRNLCMEIKT